MTVVAADGFGAGLPSRLTLAGQPMHRANLGIIRRKKDRWLRRDGGRGGDDFGRRSRLSDVLSTAEAGRQTSTNMQVSVCWMWERKRCHAMLDTAPRALSDRRYGPLRGLGRYFAETGFFYNHFFDRNGQHRCPYGQASFDPVDSRHLHHQQR